MNLVDALQVTIGGLAAGATYALVLLGVLLIFQVSKAVNFAHGALGALAAFGAYYLYSHDYVPAAAALVVGVLAAALGAVLSDRLILAKVKAGRPGFDLVATLGVLLLLTALMERFLGGQSYGFLSLMSRESVTVGGVFVNGSDVAVIVLMVVLSTVGYLVLQRTHAGVALRATSADPVLARSLGVNVALVRTVVWAIAGALAGVSGILIASRLSVDAFYMMPFLVKAFIAGIVGGLDRLVAPLSVAVGLGVYEAWAVYLLGAEYRTPVVFLLIIVLIAVLPQRLLAERHEARA